MKIRPFELHKIISQKLLPNGIETEWDNGDVEIIPYPDQGINLFPNICEDCGSELWYRNGDVSKPACFNGKCTNAWIFKTGD